MRGEIIAGSGRANQGAGPRLYPLQPVARPAHPLESIETDRQGCGERAVGAFHRCVSFS